MLNPNIDLGQVINLAGILLAAGALYGAISTRLREGERRFTALEGKVDGLWQIIMEGKLLSQRMDALEAAMLKDCHGLSQHIERVESVVATLQTDRWKHEP